MIVLDTHVLIWSVQDDAKLGRDAAALIESTADKHGLIIPAICAWEAAQVEKRGRVKFPGGVGQWFAKILRAPAFTLCNLEPAIAIDSVMDWSHKDPADRIIVATARHLRVPLLTINSKILDHAASGHVEAIDARR